MIFFIVQRCIVVMLNVLTEQVNKMQDLKWSISPLFLWFNFNMQLPSIMQRCTSITQSNES